MEPKTARTGRDGWTLLGTTLLWFGAAVWGVYAVVRYGLGNEVPAIRFLPFHLAGVIPGMLLRRRHSIRQGLRRLFRSGDDD